MAYKERSERHVVERPYFYLDELISRLEVLHLKGFSNVPRSFMPRLEVVSKLLPPEIDAPSEWRRRIARVIDQCFELQERVLQSGRKGME